MERKFQVEQKSLKNLCLEMKWKAVKMHRAYPGEAGNPWKYRLKIKLSNIVILYIVGKKISSAPWSDLKTKKLFSPLAMWLQIASNAHFR